LFILPSTADWKDNSFAPAIFNSFYHNPDQPATSLRLPLGFAVKKIILITPFSPKVKKRNIRYYYSSTSQHKPIFPLCKFMVFQAENYMSILKIGFWHHLPITADPSKTLGLFPKQFPFSFN